MVSNDIGRAAASGFLIISKLVQKGNATDVILDCDYTVENSDFIVQWVRSDLPVYEWRPNSEPIVRGILDGRLDLTYRASDDPLKARRALHVLEPDETLSGEYTCIVNNGHSEARQTRNMLVFSPQNDMSLNWHHIWEHDRHHHHQVEVACLAKGVYPQPNLVLQRDHVPVDRQQQRVWRSGEGALLDAKTSAHYRHRELYNVERFTCKLEIPDAGYVAMLEKQFVFRNSTHNSLVEKESKTTINQSPVLTASSGRTAPSTPFNARFVLYFSFLFYIYKLN